MRVLIFDDDDSIGRFVVRAATMTGADAVAVSDAESFAAQIQNQAPHVVVLDLQLGATDGVEQLRKLADWEFAGTLVLMSGFDERVLATAMRLAKSLNLKVANYLKKPLRLADVNLTFENLQRALEPINAERLRDAIKFDEMNLEFQPVVTRTPNRLEKLEALVRWDHPVLGRLQPMDFLPMAENDGALIDILSEWVIHAAANAYHVLAELGISVPLSVNMPLRSLQDRTMPDRLQQRLRDADMPATHFQIEITCTNAFTDLAPMMDVLSRLQLKGIMLALDGFGVGYSCLQLLQHLPFSEIKMHRVFIGDVAVSASSRAIVKSMFELSESLGITCIAVGVETEEIADLLAQIGITRLVGHLVARPMEIESIPFWLSQWTGAAPVAPARQTEAPANPTDGKTASSAILPPKAKTEGVHLPPRQLQVMQLLNEGCSVKEIARRLDLGIGTVKVHLSLAYSALGARNRIDAINRARPMIVEAAAAGRVLS